MRPLLATLLASLFCVTFTASVRADDNASTKVTEEGFKSLFDGKTLDGWKKSEENPESFEIQDGTIVAKGERGHLFYVGEGVPFKNFHFKAEVMTTPGSNSGIYFHTKYQVEGWPKHGHECQVNVSQQDPKKSSSLYGVDNTSNPPVQDNQWYTQEIIVNGRNIKLLINGEVMVDHTEAADKTAESKDFERRLGEGTFAIQAHDPASKCYFRNLRVKALP